VGELQSVADLLDLSHPMSGISNPGLPTVVLDQSLAFSLIPGLVQFGLQTFL
jgi:hypothetical protein